MRSAKDKPAQADSPAPAPTEDRRRAPRPDTPQGYLQQLPALVLLQRLASPVIALDQDGTVVYANPACVSMLGYGEGGLDGTPLHRLLVTEARRPRVSALDTLRAAVGVTTVWRHRPEGAVRVAVLGTMLLREDDPVLLVSLADVTEWVWNHNRDAALSTEDAGGTPAGSDTSH
ncbi:PAS domain-containing protein [Mycobacterium sp. HUMS_1102779]|uniref:PAS domain-containing protein n=1 Tax=Mycobacterium sp. HUMS_1102779 TaxID=3383487 RepID=UPI003899F7B1